MRTPFLLLTVTLIVHGKFVKIENLHFKEVNEDGTQNWHSDSSVNRTTMPRGPQSEVGGGSTYRYDSAGKAKLLKSKNEINLDTENMSTDATTSKLEWKSFYYPNHYHGHTTSTGVSNAHPFSWSNGVINNNNLLTVGGFNPGTGVPGDLGYKPTALGGTTSTLQYLLFSVMGLVTFLLNSVMALLLSVKVPGLEGLLATLLGGVGLGGLGALNKQDVAVDTKGKHMEYVHLPEQHQQGLDQNNNQVADNLEYYEKNR